MIKENKYWIDVCMYMLNVVISWGIDLLFMFLKHCFKVYVW